MELRLHGKGKSGIGTSYHQILQAPCVPPRSAAPPSITADDTAACSTPTRQLCQIWISPMQADATISIAQILRFGMLKILRCFQLFNMSTIDLAFSTCNSPNLYRPTLVPSYGPSDPPRLLFTSILHSRCRMPCCRQILTFREKVLAPKTDHGAPHLEIPCCS